MNYAGTRLPPTVWRRCLAELDDDCYCRLPSGGAVWLEDTLYTHFSVRLPGDGEPRFLINPFGMMFDEVTASNLIVVDMQGKVVEGHAPANSAGFTIHSAVHMAREDAHCVIHTHTLPGMAVAACQQGLLQQPDQHRILPARRLPPV